MARYLISRILQLGLTLWAVVTVTFFMVRLAPGDPFGADKVLSPHVRERINEYYGFDQPIYVQYGRYLGKLVQGDLGVSTKYEGRTVAEIIRDSFPISLRLGVLALCFALLLGVPVGIFAAAQKNTALDFLPMSVAMIGICLPTFVMGPLLSLFLGLKLQIFSVAGLFEWRDYILPALTMGLFYAAIIARMTRGGMLEVLSQDYIRTAKAKGVSGTKVLFKHSLRAGLLPVISYLGPAMVGIISGSFIIEKVFRIPGLGQHFVEAASTRDFTLVTGVTAFYAALLIVANLLVDIVLVLLNPRLKFSAS